LFTNLGAVVECPLGKTRKRKKKKKEVRKFKAQEGQIEKLCRLDLREWRS
jgi:hypothetical protein